MTSRTGEAVWQGDLETGGGTVRLGGGAFSGPYSFKSRFSDSEGITGTSPEELIGAAHAACYSMALSLGLSNAGHPPTRVHTVANVRLERQDAGFAITRIDLHSEVEAPGIDEESFRAEAETAKAGCPVSKALSGTEITLDAKLL
ncbi:MAG: OsmC family protein [Acidimicrobiales bacterium]